MTVPGWTWGGRAGSDMGDVGLLVVGRSQPRWVEVGSWCRNCGSVGSVLGRDWVGWVGLGSGSGTARAARGGRAVDGVTRRRAEIGPPVARDAASVRKQTSFGLSNDFRSWRGERGWVGTAHCGFGRGHLPGLRQGGRLFRRQAVGVDARGELLIVL